MAGFLDRVRNILRGGGTSAPAKPATSARTSGRKVNRSSTREDDYFRDGSVWKKVRSSNVHSIAYFVDLRGVSGRENTLGVRFQPDGSGPVTEYRFYGVEMSTWVSMLAAASHGRYVWQSLRDRFDYRPVGVVSG